MNQNDKTSESYSSSGAQSGGTPQPPTHTNSTENNSKMLTYIGSGIAGLIMLCIVGAGVVYFVNPFGILGLFSSGEQIAEAMPQDTLMYMTVDLLNTQTAEMRQVLNTFDDALEDVDLAQDEESEELTVPPEVDEFLAELDMTFEDDIATWVGRHIGLGFTNLDFGSLSEPSFGVDSFDVDPFDEFANSLEAIFAIESRDNDAADSFIDKLKKSIVEGDNAPNVATEEYEGVTFYTISEDDDPFSISFGRSENLVLIAFGSDAFKKSINAKKDEASLATLPAFEEAFAPLPEKRFLSIYYNGAKYIELIESMQDSMAGPSFDLEKLVGGELDFMVLSLTAIPEGLSIDSNTTYLNIDESRRAIYQQLGDSLNDTISLLPESTLFYSGGGGLGQLVGSMFDAMGEEPGFEFVEQSLDEAASFIGFHPTKELLPILDQNFIIAAAQTGTGSLKGFSGIDANVIALFGTSDIDEMGRIAQSFSGSLEEQGFVITPETNNGLEVFNIADPTGAEMPIAFGVGNDYLTVGTSTADMNNLFAGGASVLDSDKHQAFVDTLPDGMFPYFFVDLREVLAMVNEVDPTITQADPEVWAGIAPIDAFAAGQSFSDNTISARMILFINSDYTLENQQASR